MVNSPRVCQYAYWQAVSSKIGQYAYRPERSLCFCRTTFIERQYDMSRLLDIFDSRKFVACHASFRLNMIEPKVSRGDYGMRKTMLAVASHATAGLPRGGLSEPHAISVLAALAQPTRLAIFRLLIKHEPVGITAGVIADTIGAPHNTLSTHLAILVRAGLLRSTRDGRTITYRSNVEGMRALIGFLVSDCCDGHPELCDLVAADAGKACCTSPGSRRKPKRRQTSAEPKG
jgi:ArsR family transcriptional regulator, arsenate/arsenite/antimonite-responsive transcriptional repressor